jgi:polysaccharide biosynthesis transport protein
MSRFAELIGLTDFNEQIVRRDNSEKAIRPRLPEIPPHTPHIAEVDFLSFAIQVLRKRKFTIIGFFLLVVLLVTVASLFMKPKYEAVARIVINHENANPLGFKDMGDDRPDYDEYTVSLDTQLQILQSETLALQVIDALHLDTNPAFAGRMARKRLVNESLSDLTTRERQRLITTFLSGLSVSKEKNTRVIEISYKSKDAKLSADIANAVTTAYIQHNFKMRFDSTMQTSNWLTQQLAELQTKVEESQQKLVDYQKQHGFVELDNNQNVVTGRLDDLNKELTAAQADRINKEANYRLTLAGNPELTAKAERDALIDKLNAQEDELKTQYAQATVQLGPSNPKVLELSSQMKETQTEIDAELRKMSDKVRSEYLEALAREKMIRAAVEEQKQQTNKLNENAIEYSLLKRDAESNRQLYEGLLQKLKEAGVSAGLRSSNIQIVDVAQIPGRPTEPNLPLNMALAAMLGLVGGVGLAFVQERFDGTLRNSQEIQVLSPLPQLGIIPLGSTQSAQLPVNGKTVLLKANSMEPNTAIIRPEPMSALAESYRALVNSVLLSAPVPPKTILLTSAITGEGKTTTSINFATVLAKQGNRVLLVDADLRRPSIHRALGLSPSNGLSSVLKALVREKAAGTLGSLSRICAGVILPVPGIANLFVMPAGPADEEPAELMGSVAMQNLLREWAAQFDYVIIDSSPLLVVSDAMRLSVAVDSVILVIRSGYTPRAAFARAHEMLLQVKAAVMGFVFNAADFTSPELSHYRQYSSYGYQSKVQ